MRQLGTAFVLLASLWRCGAAQTPAAGGSNLAKPRMAGVAIASEFGQWSGYARGPILPPGGTVTVTSSAFTLPDGSAWVPFGVGLQVAISGDQNPETVTITAVSCGTGGTTCAFAANFAFSHPGNFTVSSGDGGLQEAINYEAQFGGGVVAADPAFTGSVAALLASLKLPSNVLLVDETGGNFNFYGLGNGAAPSLIARFSSATGTNLGGGGGSGTVTSVGLALPSVFTVSDSPVTIAGTLTGALASQLANTVFAGPSSGAASAPAFRGLAGADLPAPSASTLGGIESQVAVAHEWINSISTAGVPGLSQPAFVDLLGTAGDGQLANGYSGVGTCAAHQWASALSRNAVPACTQPAFSDISGTATAAQIPAATTSLQGAIQLGGDLGGTSTAQTVVGMHFGSTGIPFTSSAPLSGQCLQYNGTNIVGGSCGSGGGGGVSSFQVDSNTTLTGAVQLVSGTGLSSTQTGQAATLNVNLASNSQVGMVTLTGDLAGTSAAPLVDALHVSVANSATTGTTANALTKISATGAVVSAITDTTGAVGIVTAGAGTSGSATIATAGIISCQFDATAIVVGDWVQISSVTAGNCHDAGATKPASGEIIGHATTGGAVSTVQSVLMEVSW